MVALGAANGKGLRRTKLRRVRLRSSGDRAGFRTDVSRAQSSSLAGGTRSTVRKAAWLSRLARTSAVPVTANTAKDLERPASASPDDWGTSLDGRGLALTEQGFGLGERGLVPIDANRSRAARSGASASGLASVDRQRPRPGGRRRVRGRSRTAASARLPRHIARRSRLADRRLRRAGHDRRRERAGRAA